MDTFLRSLAQANSMKNEFGIKRNINDKKYIKSFYLKDLSFPFKDLDSNSVQNLFDITCQICCDSKSIFEFSHCEFCKSWYCMSCVLRFNAEKNTKLLCPSNDTNECNIFSYFGIFSYVRLQNLGNVLCSNDGNLKNPDTQSSMTFNWNNDVIQARDLSPEFIIQHKNELVEIFDIENIFGLASRIFRSECMITYKKMVTQSRQKVMTKMLLTIEDSLMSWVSNEIDSLKINLIQSIQEYNQMACQDKMPEDLNKVRRILGFLQSDLLSPIRGLGLSKEFRTVIRNFETLDLNDLFKNTLELNPWKSLLNTWKKTDISKLFDTLKTLIFNSQKIIQKQFINTMIIESRGNNNLINMPCPNTQCLVGILDESNGLCLSCGQYFCRKCLLNLSSSQLNEDKFVKLQQIFTESLDIQSLFIHKTQTTNFKDTLNNIKNQKKILDFSSILFPELENLSNTGSLQTLKSLQRNLETFIEFDKNPNSEFLNKDSSLIKNYMDLLGKTTEVYHKCDPKKFEEIQNTLKNVKHCPNCRSAVFKANGCDVMFCTFCKCSFKWDTLEIGHGGHNPQLSEFLTKNNISKDLELDYSQINLSSDDVPLTFLGNTFQYDLIQYHRHEKHFRKNDKKYKDLILLDYQNAKDFQETLINVQILKVFFKIIDQVINQLQSLYLKSQTNVKQEVWEAVFKALFPYNQSMDILKGIHEQSLNLVLSHALRLLNQMFYFLHRFQVSWNFSPKILTKEIFWEQCLRYIYRNYIRLHTLFNSNFLKLLTKNSKVLNVRYMFNGFLRLSENLYDNQVPLVYNTQNAKGIELEFPRFLELKNANSKNELSDFVSSLIDRIDQNIIEKTFWSGSTGPTLDF